MSAMAKAVICIDDEEPPTETPCKRSKTNVNGLMSSEEATDFQFRELGPDDYEALCKLDEDSHRTAPDAQLLKAMVVAMPKCHDECPVCFGGCSALQLPCGHGFCEGCLLRCWAEGNYKCPLCNADGEAELMIQAATAASLLHSDISSSSSS